MPKQFLPLTGEDTMLRLTLARTVGMSNAAPPIIIANAAHADLLEKQVPGDSPLILEPSARNTAPAIALAALAVDDPSGALLVMPSDHVIADLAAFHRAIQAALPLVAEGWLMTLGISPDAPETGYGYIALGEALSDGAQRVSRFVEKPDREKAEAMLAEGNHVWNAGIFLFRADAYLEALGKFRPDMLRAATAAYERGSRDGRFVRPDAEAFAACPSDSIDYAVMEQSDRVGCVPVDMGWSDVGSWDVLHTIADKDGDGNTASHLATLISARGCLVRSDGPRISLVGVENLIVVATEGEVMIVPRGQSQLVKKAAEAAAAR
jgi:mannose-1-phosphate guanylyltransferase/mannose-1-phosphate guanylyltransferase/mannose-6-phosphate isomerase